MECSQAIYKFCIIVVKDEGLFRMNFKGETKMQSSLIIGCRNCAERYKRNHPFITKETGFPFPFTTAYESDDLTELTYFHTCPYCENALYMSTGIKEVINRFFGCAFHVHIHEDVIEIVGSTVSLAIPVHQEAEATAQIIEKLGLHDFIYQDDAFPKVEDILRIQQAAKEFDREKWVLRLKTNRVEDSFILSNDIWF